MSGPELKTPWSALSETSELLDADGSWICYVSEPASDYIVRCVNAHERLLRVLQEAYRQTGCDGDFCCYEWHEEARKLFDELRGEQ